MPVAMRIMPGGAAAGFMDDGVSPNPTCDGFGWNEEVDCKSVGGRTARDGNASITLIRICFDFL
jgi:hypothetical protein